MKFGTIHYMGLRLCRFWLLYKNNAQKCTEKWAYLKNGLSYSLVAWRGCYYQQSPAIATFTYAKGWKKKFKHVKIFKSTVLDSRVYEYNVRVSKTKYYLSIILYILYVESDYLRVFKFEYYDVCILVCM